MARQRRAKSETGIYHIMLRGINKQKIFFDNDDYYLFLNILSKCKTISGFQLHAYCLMSNHIHLLIQEVDEPLDKVFQRLGDTFVYWYNNKHKRCGAIFQGRYKSIPVNNDEYYVSVMRYIHQNPVKAGIVNNCSDYEFSSYNAYFKKNSFVNTGFALELMGIDEFRRIHSIECIDEFLDIEEKPVVRMSDEDAKLIIERTTGHRTPEDFKKLTNDEKAECVKQFRKEGITIRQIVRLTGISQRIVQNNSACLQGV